MITLFHGDNIQASRNALTQLKEHAKTKEKEIRIVLGRNIDELVLTQALQSHSLFGNALFVVIENLFSKISKKSKSANEFIKILSNADTDTQVVCWEDKELTKSQLSGFPPKTAIQLFKLPVLIFSFLDGIYPSNRDTSLHIFNELIQKEAPELVFSMITKRMRQLIFILNGTYSPEISDWQKGRLTTQAKHFTMEKLQAMYTKLPDIEYLIKSGTSPVNLKTHINLWLADL